MILFYKILEPLFADQVIEIQNFFWDLLVNVPIG